MDLNKVSPMIVGNDKGQEFTGFLPTYPGKGTSLESVFPICP